MPSDCGYDEEFVDPPAEYLKCIICCLVLRDPVQIATCGHRYCSPCYRRVKGYAKHINLPFTCPVDRKEIDETKVFEDMGMARIVLDLKVKCSFREQGCEWIGELREVANHVAECLYKPSMAVSGADDNALMDRISGRVGKCEDCMLDHGKELSHLKLHVQQLQLKVDQKDEEMNLLRTENLVMQRKVETLEGTNQTLQTDIAKILGRLQGWEDKVTMPESNAERLVQGVKLPIGNPRVRRSVKENAQLYMDVQVVTENSFHKWSGNDLFSCDDVVPTNFKFLKTAKIKDATDILAKSFDYTDAQCRLWPFIKRANNTVRPARIEPTESSAYTLFAANDDDPNMLVFLETCKDKFKFGLWALPEFDYKNDVLLFFKYYNPASETMSYCGSAYVSLKSQPSDLFPMLCDRAGLMKGTKLLFYEELKPGATNKVETDKPFDAAIPDLGDGDIVCFQAYQPCPELFSKPTPVEYFKAMRRGGASK